MDSRKKDYDHFLETTSVQIGDIIKRMDYEKLCVACEMIRTAEKRGNRIHISGIGKPAHIAGYMASLFSSTGTPAYFLHGTEAVHGSCGQLKPGDVVIFISNSGETEEMKQAVTAIKNNGCGVIGVSRADDSWLARESDLHLSAFVQKEGGPLDRAPRDSILAETIVLQALSVLLQSAADVSVEQYVKWHPGGLLGQINQEEVHALQGG